MGRVDRVAARARDLRGTIHDATDPAVRGGRGGRNRDLSLLIGFEVLYIGLLINALQIVLFGTVAYLIVRGPVSARTSERRTQAAHTA